MPTVRSWPKRVTLRMSNELHRQFKVACSMHGVTMNDTMIALLEREFGPPPSRKAKDKPAAKMQEATA